MPETSVHATPIATIQNATVWYFEENDESSSKYEGAVEIYSEWVRLTSLTPTWIPRGRVEQIHE